MPVCKFVAHLAVTNWIDAQIKMAGFTHTHTHMLYMYTYRHKLT